MMEIKDMTINDIEQRSVEIAEAMKAEDADLDAINAALTALGGIIGVIALILSVVVVIDRVVNHTPAGWASVMLVVLLTSSFQMIMMGVLGEYIWRNLDETRKRPLYVIEKVVTRTDEKRKMPDGTDGIDLGLEKEK